MAFKIISFPPQIIIYSEIIRILLELILRRKAGIGRAAPFPLPFFKASAAEHFYFILNDKRNDAVL